MPETNNKIRFFTFVDLIILLGILAVLFGLFLRQPLAEKLESTFVYQDITLVIETEEIDHNAVNVGDVVYFENSSEEAGTVASISFLPKYEYQIGHNGELSYVEKQNAEIVTVKIVGSGKSDELGRYLNGHLFVAPGQVYRLYTENSEFTALLKYVETTDKT